MVGEGLTRFGVVGDDTSDAIEALATLDLEITAHTVDEILATNPDAVVAVGEAGLLPVARTRPSLPILPVEAGDGVSSVPLARLEAAANRLVAGDWTTDRHPLLAVEVTEGQESIALFDAMAVTAEPAHISEYSVTANGEQVAQFRADGLVVATPAGTSGYARAAGAPVISPGAGVLALVPIAPFATTLDHWVVPDDEMTITVKRDDATVDVLADDRTIGVAAVDEPVRISTDGVIETIRVPEGNSVFEAPGTELEKL